MSISKCELVHLFLSMYLFIFSAFSEMDTDPNTIMYRVNGFDSIEVKVNPKTMEIESGRSELEEHIGQKDLDVSELISDGVLYQHHEPEFNHSMFIE